MPIRYWAMLVGLGTIWGCSFLFNAVLIRELGPLWVSAGRISIGALVCWAYFVAARKSLPRDPWLYPQLLVLGVINYAVPFALFPFAEMHLASGVVGVINGLTPMTTVLVSQLWRGGEKATWNKIMGVLIGLFGAAILASPSFGDSGGGQVLAMLAAFAATCCYAVTLNYARRFKAINSATIASTSLSAGGAGDAAGGPAVRGHAGDHAARNLGLADRHRRGVDGVCLPARLLAFGAGGRDESFAQHLHHADLGDRARRRRAA